MKQQNQNQEFRFNEVLFEHRNKEYGAYALRNESDRILTKALFVGVSLMAAVSITPFAMSAFTTDVPHEGPGGVVIDFTPVTPDEPAPPVTIVPVKPATAPNTKTFDSTVPTPSKTAPDDQTKKDPVPDDAVAGLANNLKGDVVAPNTYVPTTAPVGTGPVINTAPPTIPEAVDKNKIVEAGDLGIEANYAGGIDSFRNKVMNSFDSSGFESDGVMKTIVTFIVEMDGSISGIKANGTNADFNNEAIRTIKSVKGKWVPAKNKKGEFVRSYFKFPISMKFEN
ncbi:hypothetical protein [Chryseobacterium indologenes]|uniref:Energy transducer TonB n=1 Tax=Chryseobacterium indologenes TaxID=253 RepID=A0AAD1DWN2_CHRID|nr:hypothetical protein [Chryseobacterium indologenes]AZB20035.1 energy transducer TonB [Chryseobacterium indologenes]